MIDLHCHILPGIDDGASDLSVSLAMARAFVDDGVSVVACTPHILPGLYHNSGPQIRQAVIALQRELDKNEIPLMLVPGADNHIVQNFAGGLRSGHLLALADTRYVLVEPPHHVAPSRLEEFFFDVMVAGYVPILTHPERLTWIEQQYPLMQRLAKNGVWMQITAGSLSGSFGRRPKYWGERMLDDGIVQVLATDAHDTQRRPPKLSQGRELAERRVGALQAHHLVSTRPQGVIANALPSSMPPTEGGLTAPEEGGEAAASDGDDRSRRGSRRNDGLAGRLFKLFK